MGNLLIQGMGDYRELNIWKRSKLLIQVIYKITDQFPKKEKYGLADQMNRACISISSNIAEGHSRNSSAQTLYFINISFGSLCELESQVVVARDLNYISEIECKPILHETYALKRMISAYRNYLINRN